MKRLLLPLAALLIVSCHTDIDDNGTANNNNGENPGETVIDYRQEMRQLVISISQKAKGISPGFAIIPQNGIELLTNDGDPFGSLNLPYLNAIDGHGQEDLLYGYDNDDEATPADVTEYLKNFLDRSKEFGKKILVTDYCTSASHVEDSYLQNEDSDYISFAAPIRELNVIPGQSPYNYNNANITQLSQAKNFLYLINPENYNTKQEFITAVAQTDYDVIIMDLFLNGQAFTAAEVAQLKNKANGGSRMVICYMSIGEAEDYRYYWQQEWSTNPPEWVAAENPDWGGNYKVQYWNDEWKSIIYSGQGSYLDTILQAGFNGVYLDIIDAFEYFEE
ncbi:hypothetical protein FUA48_12510 [Flavobacterium alkalisoli]|uniref:Glycoside-hydrolase family GH114 TIM-barrel domain-containing protein n=1 Tax=Flavobacterium alkalisoli TaxID=2602769 RepID=A0A5B9FW15_9FLAO|nr:endo alpha-1,4 polygalactosaminidase [Flavobacterium alkalisoli]QEE50371.1 hypothetical protein FUA48_12510 [Flavobacterium alkalisoli]